MLADSSSNVRFEIGHVLFIDIFSYSKLLINQQSEQLQELKEIVRGTEQFRVAEAEGKLLRRKQRKRFNDSRFTSHVSRSRFDASTL
jgi:hypothetical protein